VMARVCGLCCVDFHPKVIHADAGMGSVGGISMAATHMNAAHACEMLLAVAALMG